MKLKEFSDAILDLCKAYYADIDTLTAELAAANATLDRLREAVKTGYDAGTIPWRVYDILYPETEHGN